MPNDNQEIKTFKGTVGKLVYHGSDEFRIYGMCVDEKEYPDIVRNKFGNVSIMGDILELDNDVEYTIRAKEIHDKYGISYKVINITRMKPTSSEDVYNFLCSVLTVAQADTLYKEYPNIIDIILNGETIDFNRTKGIKEKSFEKIKKKVLNNFAMMEAVTMFNGLLSFNIIQKLFERYTSVDMVRNRLQIAPYETLCDISRVGFLRADKIIQDMEQGAIKEKAVGNEPVIDFKEPVKSSKQRCLFCIIYVLEQNELEGNTYMKYVQLRNQVSTYTFEAIEHFDECLMNDQRLYYSPSDEIVAIKDTYNVEKEIARILKEGLSIQNVYDIQDIEKYKEIDGKSLTKEQFYVLLMVRKYNVSILNGSAGSGKSFTISSIIRMLDDNHKSYALMAPTGKAAKVLKEYTQCPATTIHRGLLYNPKLGWGYNEKDKLPFDIVIVDEVSMVDVYLFKHLLDAIDFSRTKLLMVGDNAQLPSVGCGNILYDLMQSKKIPVITLDKIFRYADGGLMRVATDIRRSQKYLPNTFDTTAIKYGKDYVFVNVDEDEPAKVITNLINLYRRMLDSGLRPANIQVLSPQKVGDYGSKVINKSLQMLANPNYGSSNKVTCNDVTYYEGDIIIQTSNNYRAKKYTEDGSGNEINDFDFEYEPEVTFIANGESGVIQKITTNSVVIKFDEEVVSYDKSDLYTIDLGYCITVHKSQGSSADYVIFLSPKAHTFMLNSNLMYVGVTRTKKMCYHIGMKDTVNFCLKKKEDFNRNTLLKSFLINENN